MSLIFLKRSSVFPILLCSSISLHWSPRKAFLSPCYFLELCIQMGISFLFYFPFSFSFFSQLFVRAPQTSILPFCISFSWGWSWSLPPVQCHKPPSLVLQALCLSDLIPWIYLLLLLYNCEVFKSYLNGLVVFPISNNLGESSGEFWQNVVHWRREWQATSVFLIWEPHKQNEKAKRYDTERWTPQVSRFPICY